MQTKHELSDHRSKLKAKPIKKRIIVGIFAAVPLMAIGCTSAPDAQDDNGGQTPDNGPELDAVSSPQEFASLPADEQARIKDYLDHRVLREAVLKTVSVDEDTFDCVDEFRQPGVLAEQQRTGKPVTKLEVGTLPKEMAGQVAAQKPAEGRSQIKRVDCPKGTVPIRQIDPNVIARYGTLQNYLKKPNPAIAGENYMHEANWRIADNYGMQGNMSLWDDYVQVSPEHTISQIWVQGGSGSGLQSVEAGWIKRVGETAHGFTFVTTDGYATGSWNTDNGMFIQTDNGVPIDAPWNNYSTQGGDQYDNVFLIFKSGGSTGNWYLFIEGSQVGYWPRSNFATSGLRSKAQFAAIGGEIYDNPNGSRTKTDMGSGAWPSSGFGTSAYILDLRWVDLTQTYVELSAPDSVQDEGDPSGVQKCYDISNQFSSSAGWRYHMFYGGPGRNQSCCVKDADCSSGTTCTKTGSNAGTCH